MVAWVGARAMVAGLALCLGRLRRGSVGAGETGRFRRTDTVVRLANLL